MFVHIKLKGIGSAIIAPRFDSWGRIARFRDLGVGGGIWGNAINNLGAFLQSGLAGPCFLRLWLLGVDYFDWACHNHAGWH